MNPFKYISNFFKSFSGPVVLTTEEDSNHKNTFFGRLAYRFTRGAAPHFIDTGANDDDIETDYTDRDDNISNENESERETEEPVSVKLPLYKRLWRAIFGPPREEAQAEIDEAQKDLKTFEFNNLYQPSTPNIPEEKPAANVVRIRVSDLDRYKSEYDIIKKRLSALSTKEIFNKDFDDDVNALLGENPSGNDPERKFLAMIPPENFNSIAQNYVRPKTDEKNKTDEKTKAVSLRKLIADTMIKSSEKDIKPTPKKIKQLDTPTRGMH